MVDDSQILKINQTH